MRESIFQSILAILRTCTKLQGEDGTVRVYDYPQTAPAGYPYAVVSSESFESSILDNARDSRKYIYKLQVVGEKFGDEGGMTQSDALAAMRATEDAVVALFDADNNLSNSAVVRTLPMDAQYGLTDNGARVVYTLRLSVEVMAEITY